jgi:hypothetical protein
MGKHHSTLMSKSGTPSTKKVGAFAPNPVGLIFSNATTVGSGIEQGVNSAAKLSALLVGYLWPVAAIVDVSEGYSYVLPAIAFGAAYAVGGRVPFWNADFPSFVRGYLTGAAIYGTYTYYSLRSDERTADSYIGKGVADARGVYNFWEKL